ncbi:MAG: condensation domain-containing protein [Rhabdochlamydiaceae bacterium]|nr:condensation domain-containing protein [Candidatus Amphrikana amoebophyrae]
MSQRKLGYIESLFYYIHEESFGTNNTLVFAQVSGELKEDILKRSIEALFNEHPFLRSKIVEEEGYLWVKSTVKFSDISIEFGEIEGKCEDIGEKYLKDPFSPNGPLWKLKILRKKKQNWIFLKIHHSVLDAISGINFVRDMIEFYERIEKNPFEKFDELHMLAPIEQLSGSNKSLTDYIEENQSIKPSKLDHFAFDKQCPLEERVTKIHHFEFPKDEYRAIHKTTRSNDISINSFLVAVACFAYAKFRGGKINIPFITPINLRQKCNPAISKDNFGLYITLITTFHEIDPTQNIFTFARKYKQQLDELIPITGAMPSDLETTSYETLKESFTPFRPQDQCFKSGLGLSNAGNIPFTGKGVDLAIEKIYYNVSRVAGDFPFLLHVSTLNETMFISLSYPKPLITNQQALQFCSYFIEIIREHCL